MNIRIVVLFALLLPASAAGQKKTSAETQLGAAIDKVLQGSLFTHTIAAVHVSDVKSGSVLYERNADLLLRPASNAKLATSAAAVLGLDEGFRFQTSVFAIDSSLRSLVCVGGADPLFTSQDIQKLAEIAYARGVRILDTLFLDTSLLDSTFYGAGWMWDDETDPFMPYIGSFPVDGNTIQLRMKSPTQTEKPVELSVLPSSSLLHVDNRAVSGKRSDIQLRKIPRSNRIVIEGTLAKGKRITRRVSMWRPQDVFTDLFLRALSMQGVDVDSAVVISAAHRDAPLLLAVGSHPLDAVLRVMNKESDNLCAESVLRMLAMREGKRAISAEDGLDALLRILRSAGMDTDQLHLRDGSGISFYNLLSARTLSSLLAIMARNPSFDRFASTLAVAGKDGTLAHRLRDMEKGAEFRGKTGTVSGVSALSGYAQAPGGRLLGVVILMQNFHGKHKPYRDIQDAIVRHCIHYSAAAGTATQPR